MLKIVHSSFENTAQLHSAYIHLFECPSVSVGRGWVPHHRTTTVTVMLPALFLKAIGFKATCITGFFFNNIKI